MEPITHLLTGYHLSNLWPSSLKYSRRAVILGALFPDIDHILIILHKEYYLLYHRTFTHSILTAPLFAFFLVFIFKMKHKNGVFSSYFFLVFIGILSHLALDLVVSYGIKLFYPFGQWSYLSWSYVIDIVILGLLIFPLLLQKLKDFQAQKTSLISLILVLSFLLFRGYLHNQTLNHFHQLYPTSLKIGVMPTPFSPFRWKVIVEKQNAYQYFEFNWLKKQKLHLKVFLKNQEIPLPINTLPLVKIFLNWAQFPWVQKESNTAFYLRDLRFYYPQRLLLAVRLVLNKGKVKEEFVLAEPGLASINSR